MKSWISGALLAGLMIVIVVYIWKWNENVASFVIVVFALILFVLFQLRNKLKKATIKDVLPNTKYTYKANR